MTVFDTTAIIQAGGYLALFGVLFAETGILIGVVLPGESLLLSAGFIAATGYLNIWLVIFIAFLAAVFGDNVGYALGKKYGPKIFVREQSFFFDKQYIGDAEAFYKTHGGKTVLLARFIPIVRTLAPILAGVGKMRYGTFLTYNLAGAAAWAASIGLIGYYSGKFIPGATQYIVPIIVGLIIISLVPVLLHQIMIFVKRSKKGSRQKSA